jgi:hypothetical protein
MFVVARYTIVLTDFPPERPPRPSAHPFFPFSGLRPAPTINFACKLHYNAMADSSDYKEMQMQLALEVCRQVADPNFSAIAWEFPLTDRHTLRRRFEGIQTSRREAHSIYH